MNTKSNIENLARTFVDAAVALGNALAAQLGEQDVEMAAKVAQSLSMGERLVLCMEFHDQDPAIRLVTMDDYHQVKRVMSVAGQIQQVRH
jgi:hypothetical protein